MINSTTINGATTSEINVCFASLQVRLFMSILPRRLRLRPSHIFITVFCLFAKRRFHTYSKTQTHALCAMSGASDYAVKPNQFPVFGLMDAIIFMDLKQVSVPPPPPPTPSQTHTWTHLSKHGPFPLSEDMDRYNTLKHVLIFSTLLKWKCSWFGFNYYI